MSKLIAAIVAGALSLFDVAPSCKPVYVDKCSTYRGNYSLSQYTDVSSPVALRMTVSKTGVGAELNEPKSKCSIVPHESYKLVSCAGAESVMGEDFPGCGDVFCIQVLSDLQLWFELKIPETGCDVRDSIDLEEIELEP